VSCKVEYFCLRRSLRKCTQKRARQSENCQRTRKQHSRRQKCTAETAVHKAQHIPRCSIQCSACTFQMPKTLACALPARCNPLCSACKNSNVTMPKPTQPLLH
jgi:hypothetical protein